MFNSLPKQFLAILKMSVAFTLFLTFFLFFENCACQDVGTEYLDEKPADNTSDVPKENPDTNTNDPGPIVQEPVITFLTPTNTALIVNVGDGFIPFLPAVEMNIVNADFESTKIDDPAKPCDNAFTITAKDQSDADIPFTTPPTISCTYVDKNAVTLSITPSSIDTSAYTLSNDQVITVTLEGTIGNNFTTASAEVTAAADMEASALSIGTWVSDLSPIAAADQGHAHFFGNSVLTVNPATPNSLKISAASYGAGYLSSLAVGLQKYNNKSTYYLFEPSSSSTTTSGYLTLQIIDLSNPDALNWTSYALGGTIGYNNNGAYINHNAPYLSHDSYFAMVTLHGGYNHRFSTSASYSPYAPAVRVTPAMNVYNLTTDNYNNLDAGHIILQINSDVLLKVGRYSTPHFQQLKQASYADAISFDDLSSVVTGSYSSSANNFSKGNKVLRSANGNHYVYVMGDTNPFVAEVSITGTDITGLNLTAIDNPVSASYSLDNPHVVYDETNDVLILLVAIRWGVYEIHVGKFDSDTDATPTWERYF